MPERSDNDESEREANLARIGDIQRRSRAKVKEYLSDIETNIRSCERTRVEANRELQILARKVL
ncbi:hypothetical protein LTR56_027830 [Elasticomyces elasticus]|nr:hypothetical protein LTR56_027830 [Elasticomyces elasticus]KAK3614067.1 hypothetical protein LTR22_027904 [Elasticomyces elasticus]KAK4893542.1 hypothetical protein LTR49_028482 [Elasticomyces elasticus]KAK5735694.1 hypothetical protein LTS12_026403 [Elasticomyces elasticus]